jgi:hypothetical protein
MTLPLAARAWRRAAAGADRRREARDNVPPGAGDLEQQVRTCLLQKVSENSEASYDGGTHLISPLSRFIAGVDAVGWVATGRIASLARGAPLVLRALPVAADRS